VSAPRAAAGLVLALAASAFLSACGSGHPSPESVVRAWSQALNTDDNNRAADLFAPDAEVVQAGRVLTLRTHQDAVDWNAGLPCAGRIVSIVTRGETARATFLLGNRRHGKCDGPGQHATAIFKVVKGKIVLWHQTPPPAPGPPTISASVL
jgi:limonene-1,2-epoxide hydrolase